MKKIIVFLLICVSAHSFGSETCPENIGQIINIMNENDMKYSEICIKNNVLTNEQRNQYIQEQEEILSKIKTLDLLDQYQCKIDEQDSYYLHSIDDINELEEYISDMKKVAAPEFCDEFLW